ncbi:MAG TPA: hypothetical protein VIJ14_04185, partial [Rhabdochlamydiaceae bacterium]
MSAIGEYFPPNVIKELNFFNVKGSTELGYRLRTLQRVVAAAIGAYLFYRYHPLLQSQISQIPYASKVVSLASFFVGYTLCSPATFLVLGGRYLYEGGVEVFLGVKHKHIESIVMGSLRILVGYYCWNEYRTIAFCFYKSP